MNEQYGNRKRLELAINGLPLKVNEIIPEDVVLADNPPLYGFTLAPDMDQNALAASTANMASLMCRSSVDAPKSMPGPLVGQRSRVNCTMPGPEAVGAGSGGVSHRIDDQLRRAVRTGRNHSTGSGLQLADIDLANFGITIHEVRQLVAKIGPASPAQKMAPRPEGGIARTC